MARQELARFLRERRERLHPADVGLRPADVGLHLADVGPRPAGAGTRPDGAGSRPPGPGPSTGGRRRTPGLRREEVAQLAHVSVDYYCRLEQARGPRPSPRVLDALAGALRLTRPERTHLFRLAGTAPTAPAAPVRRVRPYVTELLSRMPGTAAIVTDATYDVIAWNPLARALLGAGIGAEPNFARRRFLGGGDAFAEVSAEESARVVVSRLRRAAARYPHDEALAGLLAELRAGSEEFTEVWDLDPVHAPGHRTKTLTHPTAGPIRVNCDVLVIPDDDQQVVFVTADPGSPSARALDRLLPAA